MAALIQSADEALAGIGDGRTIMFGGFVSAGTPKTLVDALVRSGVREITGIANNIGFGDSLDRLCEQRQLRKMITSFAIRASAAKSSRFEALFRAGEVDLELVPQGTLAERIRAGGAGIGGFYTKTGAGTSAGQHKPTRILGGEMYVLEEPLRADVALIRAYRADTAGNLVYRGASRNFNTLMATAADLVVAEVDEVVSLGGIDPEHVVTPGIFVDRLVVATSS
jgi:3-oxoadipate CoA-transferase, alpha subunit